MSIARKTFRIVKVAVAAGLLLTLLIHVLVWGSASFLADVVLLCVYIDTVERGTLPPG